MTVLEVQAWDDNAALIKAVFDIHVWPKVKGPTGPDVMDVTYGRGLWWTWINRSTHGLQFTAHDIIHDDVDFRHLPEPDESMDVIAFDPPYIAQGGRRTSTVPERNDRYGLDTPYESPASLQAYINDGITECARVLRPQGMLLAKVASYISSGKPWLGEYHTIHHALSVGLKVDDIFVHVSGTGPQPKRETQQQHTRSNSSRLLVLRKPGRRTRRN